MISLRILRKRRLASALLLLGAATSFAPSAVRRTPLPTPRSSHYLDSLSAPAPASEGGGAPRRSPSVIGGEQEDPNSPEAAARYGLTPSRGADGYDAGSDAVGPGIYGGCVRRDDEGNVLYGDEYGRFDHGRPGPLYDGNGYTLMSRAVMTGDPDVVRRVLADFPHLIGEIGTGGGTPLHVAGMSEGGQRCARALVDAGADVQAIDAYGYTALHRMASNDLADGAEALVEAGADPHGRADGTGSTPIEIARKQRNVRFLMCMQRLGHYD